MIDANTFIGAYPFRHVPHPDPDVLVRVLDREGIDTAWVGHLPSACPRDPGAGNETVVAALAPHAARLAAVPAIRPDWPRWEHALGEAMDRGAVAVRAYPQQWGFGSHHPAMLELAIACGERGVPLVLTTRFEDVRQRSALDVAGDLSGAHVRAIVRADTRVRVIVTSAGRALIEESHWGLTPGERARLSWDISWIWGPPEDELAHVLRTIGSTRFVFGSGWPLRLSQTPRANLELLPDELRSPLAPLGDAAQIPARSA
jgi:predicted TIM-barrel fold metal-dependent hydrolase